MAPANVDIERVLRFPVAVLQADAAVLAPRGEQDVVMISTRHDLVGAQDTRSDRDKDLFFTATRAQVALLAADGRGHATAIHPIGFIYRPGTGKRAADFGSMLGPDQFARTRKNATAASFDWFFHVPADLAPSFMRMKNLRLPLVAELEASDNELRRYLDQVDFSQQIAEPADDANGDDGSTDMQRPTGVAGVKGFKIEVNGDLPVRLSRNWLSRSVRDAQYNENALVTGVGKVRIVDQRVNRRLELNAVHAEPGSAIVRVEMTADRAKSWLGQAREFAGSVSQTPMLVSRRGDQYTAIGYVRYDRGEVELYFPSTRLVRSLHEIDPRTMKPDEGLMLYFLVNRGDRLTEFRIGQAMTQQIDLPVPR
jgi:hypothetical protein